MGFEAPLWRALGVYRVLALGYVIVLYAPSAGDYLHPVGGAAVLAAMAAWTAATALVYRGRGGRTWPVLAADIAVGAAAVLVTRLVDSPERIEAGASTLPSIWSAAPVLAWAIKGGWPAGAAGAAIIAVADVVERQRLAADTVHNIVLLLVAGTVIGYLTDVARRGELTLARALRVEAATRERERLARDIHDSVLQVLALVQRRGAEIGGETATLGRLAGEQGAALRVLVTASRDADTAATALGAGRAGAETDLRSLLKRQACAAVTVSGPATPVLLPAGQAREVAAAVAAAVDNVGVHAGPGAHAWVLVEDEPDTVAVSVRDDGCGIRAGRLEAAEAEGRLGFVQSIRGRLADLGGTAVVTSAPGEGTEVELRLPRTAGR
ncbi:MAG: MacS family sensor histidine kinase [Carbonactinosporaceae bacterium]